MGVNGLVGTPFGLSGTSIEPKRGILGQKGAFWGPWLQKKAHYQVKVCGDHEPNPVGPTGESWDQIRHPRAGQGRPGPSKGLFWVKTGPFRGPGVPLRSVKRQEHMVYMQSIQLDQPVAVGTKSGHLRPPEDLRGPQKGFLGPN